MGLPYCVGTVDRGYSDSDFISYIGIRASYFTPMIHSNGPISIPLDITLQPTWEQQVHAFCDLYHLSPATPPDHFSIEYVTKEKN